MTFNKYIKSIRLPGKQMYQLGIGHEYHYKCLSYIYSTNTNLIVIFNLFWKSEPILHSGAVSSLENYRGI